MISAETWYKTLDNKFLSIIKISKIWQYYLKGC